MTRRAVTPRWRRTLALVLMAGTLSLGASEATAQVWAGPSGPRAGSVEVSAGAAFVGKVPLGDRDAEESRNINTGSGPFALFASESTLGAGPAALLRLGVYLSRAVSVEAGVQYGRPRLSTRLSGDVEQAPTVTADETLTRYLIDGSLLLHLTGLSFAGGRGVPFVSAGGGYLRELHEQNQLIETGREYHAGGGVKFWMGTGARLGIRVDAGASMRSGGVDFRTGRRTVPMAAGSVMYRF